MNQLKDLEFLKYVQQFYRKRVSTKEAYDVVFHEAINYYVNYLEQLTLDYWEDLLANYKIYNAHFQQSYEMICSSRQEIDIRRLSDQFLLGFYDKLIEFYPLNIESDFIIAFSLWYPSIFGTLSGAARKDLSDTREGLTMKYQSKEMQNIQQKLKFEFAKYKIVDLSYILFYDVFYIDTLKQPMQAYHQLLDVVDDAFIQYFQHLYNQSEIQEQSVHRQLQITNKKSEKEPLKKFKQECFLTILQMRMKNPEMYTKFLKHYLKL